jgi:hypothetical protein
VPRKWNDLAQPTFVNHLFGERDGGHAAVVEANGVAHVVFAHGGQHRLGLRNGVGERLFADDHLARACGGDGDLGVRVAGRDDVNQVNVVAFKQFLVIGLVGLEAELVGGSPSLFLRCARTAP